jgi:putative hydrolase of the HAD superfamily
VPIRAVVFDLFDTLVDLSMNDLPRMNVRGKSIPTTAGKLHEVVENFLRIDFDRFLDSLSEVDREFRRSRYANGLELPTIERFEVLASRLQVDAPELPQALTDTHMGLIRDQVQVPAHHTDVLQSLGSRVRLGLCSNFSCSEMALELLDDSGIGPHLESVIISDAVGIRKPRSEIFEAVLAELDVTPAETLHVGDSLQADVNGAAPLGIRTAWITRRIPDVNAALSLHQGAAPDHVIQDLSEIEALLDANV